MSRFSKCEIEFLGSLRKVGLSRSLCESVNEIRRALFESETGSGRAKIKRVLFKNLFGVAHVLWTFPCSPITIITGLNGSGKTTLINFIGYFLSGAPEFRAKVSRTKFDRVTFKTEDGDFAFTKDDLDEMAGKGNSTVKIVSVKDDSDNLDGIFNTSGELESVANASGADIDTFIKILNRYGKHSFVPKTYSIEDGRVVIHSDSGDLGIDDLSDGERAVVSMWYDILFSPVDVLLVEEPERTLHIVLQHNFIDDLKRVCDSTGKRAIVVTHSPHIVLDNDDMLPESRSIAGSSYDLDAEDESYRKKLKECSGDNYAMEESEWEWKNGILDDFKEIGKFDYEKHDAIMNKWEEKHFGHDFNFRIFEMENPGFIEKWDKEHKTGDENES